MTARRDLIQVSLDLEAQLHGPPLIRVNGKAPLDQGWPDGPFDDPEGWRDRLALHDHNVGFVCGHGIAVIDADLYKPQAQGSWDAIRDECDLSIETVTALTGQGGQHLFYCYPSGLHLPCWAGADHGYPGVEVKGDGGFVVCEPSIHPVAGKPYVFEEGYRPGQIPLAPLTDRFLVFIGASDQARPSGGRGKWRYLSKADRAKLDRFDKEAVDLLMGHFGGTEAIVTSNGTIRVTRPDKEDGSSISVGHIGPGVAKCFTDKWPPFSQGGVYDLPDLRKLAGIKEKAGPWTRSANSSEGPEPGKEQPKRAATKGFYPVDLKTIDPEEVDWHWQDRIPRGLVTLMVGDPDVGKSYVTVDISTRSTRGDQLPGDDRAKEAVAVLMVNYEDLPAQTVRPRADMGQGFPEGKFFLLREAHSFTVADVAQMDAWLEDHPDVVLVVIDPMGSFIGGDVPIGYDNQVRAALGPLQELAARRNLAVVVVMHPNKDENGKAIYRVAGSLGGFAGLVRSVLLVGQEAQSGRRAVVPMKHNLAPKAQPLEFTITAEGVAWLGEAPDLTADVLLAAGPGREPVKLNAAALWLLEQLLPRGTLVERSVIEAASKVAEHSWMTVRRAYKELGVDEVRDRDASGRMGTTQWFLAPL